MQYNQIFNTTSLKTFGLTLQEGAEVARCDGCSEDLFRQITPSTPNYLYPILSSVFFIAANLILRIKRNGVIYVSMFLLFIFLYEVVMLGVFYFLYSAVFTQFTMVLYYFIARYYQRKIIFR